LTSWANICFSRRTLLHGISWNTFYELCAWHKFI